MIKTHLIPPLQLLNLQRQELNSLGNISIFNLLDANFEMLINGWKFSMYTTFHCLVNNVAEEFLSLNLTPKEEHFLNTVSIYEIAMNGIDFFLNEEQNFVESSYVRFASWIDDLYSYSDDDSDKDKLSKADTDDSSNNINSILDIGHCSEWGSFEPIGNLCSSEECKDTGFTYE